jgi:phosphodiesterase/alkaline phosphatase D-like protein
MKKNSLPNVAFGSCNRQNLPQEFWKNIALQHPSHFLWMGDAVYAKGHSVDRLFQAYDTLLSNENYQRFTKGVYIDGVWDDHDYGVNDAGGYISNRLQRQVEYLTFLQKSGNTNIQPLFEQDGIYHTLDIPFDDRLMKVIFLDTRSFRSVHYIRSLGEFRFPLSALIASAIRASYSIMGFGRNYAGSMLGEAQWTWLEHTLQQSTADVHIIISSVQVLTSNPVFESWGHFPIEKQRLLTLLGRYQPQHTVLLSGDVHLGEISHASYGHNRQRLVEVTSSGLTHTCATGKANNILCPVMMHLFSAHRISEAGYYPSKNYGMIQFHRVVNNSYNITFSVRSLESETMGHTQLLHHLRVGDQRAFEDSTAGDGVHFADFPLLSPLIQGAVYTLVLVIVWIVYWIVRRCLRTSTDVSLARKSK